ncbi:MAG: hypothetical protein KatS3mg023_3909 [Armatimonadota bacterium]|nr:MAG: hypothetical protein KatS3mg023_3909 [Armatimonadota bacterium]
MDRQLALDLWERELRIYSPWLAMCEFGGFRKPFPAIDLRGLDRQQALEQMKRVAAGYELRGWRVTWLFDEAAEAVLAEIQDALAARGMCRVLMSIPPKTEAPAEAEA